MLDLGVIEPSDSSYAAPVTMVRKPDGSIRFCLDFRKLNRVVVYDPEPIPNPEVLFAQLSGSKFFTKIDLCKGYWEIPMSKESKPKTAFVTPVSGHALWISHSWSSIYPDDEDPFRQCEQCCLLH